MLKKCTDDLENQGHSPIIVNLGDFYPNTERINYIIVESYRFRDEESEKLKFMLKKWTEDLENQGHSPVIVNLGDFYPNTARINLAEINFKSTSPRKKPSNECILRHEWCAVRFEASVFVCHVLGE